MTLESFLGKALYWPVVVIVIGFAIASAVSNVSLVYTELYHQLTELRRLKRECEAPAEPTSTGSAGASPSQQLTTSN